MSALPPASAFDSGVSHHQAGRLDDAIACYEAHLAVHDNDGPAWSNLGTALKALNRFDEALDAYMQALACEPGNADTLFNVGSVFQAQGLFKQAIDGYRRTLEVDPGHERALYSRAICRLHQEEVALAIEDFRAALAINPGNSAVWINLGTALRRNGSLDEAVKAYERATEVDPGNFTTWMCLGEALMENRSTQRALDAYLQAGVVDPGNGVATINAAIAYWHLGNMDKVRELAMPLLDQERFHRTAAELLVNSYEQEGNVEEAEALFDRTLGDSPDRGTQIFGALLTRLIPRSVDDARHLLARAERKLAEMADKPGVPGEISRTPFPFAYLGFSDRDLQVQYAKALSLNFPELVEPGPWVAEWPKRPPRQRLRVGIISHFFGNPTHIVRRSFLKMAERFDRSRFEVVLLIPGHGQLLDDLWEYADDVRLIVANSALDAAAQVAAADLDALLYTDIGMDTYSYQLGLSRLAPVQCVTGGHPVTTGLPHMDYFISSRWFEPDDADAHFTERLIRCENNAFYFPWPDYIEHFDVRAHLGLDPSATIYGCLQSTFKLDVHFDAALAGILEADPSAIIVLIQSPLVRHWLDRFRHQYGELGHRFRYMGRIAYSKFCGALRDFDALLDPFFFSGGTTTYASFSTGSPVVTFAAPYLRGRCATGIYRRIGISGLTATNTEKYVQIATRLAHDKAWAQSLREQILENGDTIFQQTQGMDEVIAFLETAILASRRGEQVTTWPLPSSH